MAAEDGLKAQKLLAQGSALGNVGKNQGRPERAKAFNFKAFALSGRLCFLQTLPRAMPWARSFWAFSPSSAAIIRSAGYALSSVRRPGGFAIRRQKMT